MLKLNDGYLLADVNANVGHGIIMTTSDIKKEVKERTKEEGKEVYFADVVQDYTLIGMDERGNGYYI